MKKSLFIVFMFCMAIALSGCDFDNEEASITAYTRDTTSGTRDGFFTTIGFSEAIKDNTVLVSGYVELETNGAIISGVSNDQFGIGYISLISLADSGNKGLNFEGVAPTEANVVNGTYTMTRNFNYIIREDFDTDAERDIVEAFVAFLETSDAKSTVISNDGIVDIDANDPTWNDIKGDYPIHLEDNSGITINIGGSSSVSKVAVALSAEFSAKCGNFVAEHNHTGSGDAYKRTQGSEKDGANKLHIGVSSREFQLTSDEIAVEGTYGTICVDAIVAIVHTSNSITNITALELKRIYAGEITNWSELE